MAISKEKANGRFYTPDFMVDNILDLSGYDDDNILYKHIIDNSCGNGAFLVKIVDRYCQKAISVNLTKETIKTHLGTYIHGIEIDYNECKKCITNINSVAESYGISCVKWDIKCTNALTVNEYNNKMDFVVGNPPYVRIHNLGKNSDNIRNYKFSQNGMTDMFIVFYEIGIKMLNNTGILGYITPSSYFNSLAGRYLRNYIISNNLLFKIVNLKHYQVFECTTYSAISILCMNNPKKEIEYFEYDENNKKPIFIDLLNTDYYYINKNFYFSNKENLVFLKKVLSFKTYKENFIIKNGFATLADKFFIGSFEFNEFIIPVVKASTGKSSKCIFPYNKSGKIVSFDEIKKNEKLYEYYMQNEYALRNRSLEKQDIWYGFGRSQAISDVYKNKYSINSIISNINDIKLISCIAGVGVYSGLYILTDISEKILKKILSSDDFMVYISLLGKFKSGGYYTFSSKDLKQYLEYKYQKESEYD